MCRKSHSKMFRALSDWITTRPPKLSPSGSNPDWRTTERKIMNKSTCEKEVGFSEIFGKVHEFKELIYKLYDQNSELKNEVARLKAEVKELEEHSKALALGSRDLQTLLNNRSVALYEANQSMKLVQHAISSLDQAYKDLLKENNRLLFGSKTRMQNISRSITDAIDQLARVVNAHASNEGS